MHSLAIVGSGPTAIYTAFHLASGASELAITIFESQNEAGKGTPYHQDWNDENMLSNIASIEIPRLEQTLTEWLENQDDNALALMGIMRKNITERAFFPRVVLGRYFQSQLRQMQQRLKNSSVHVRVKTRHRVTDAMMAGKKVQLTFDSPDRAGQTAEFDYVVFATGHSWPLHTEEKPGYFLSPWPASALRNISNCHVGIRGTSLSAIDAAVALSVARGAFFRSENGQLDYFPEPGTEGFRITLMSRKGILPEADFYHPIPYTPLQICTREAIDNLIATCPGTELLDRAFELFKREIQYSDADYAAQIKLMQTNLEAFPHVYFGERDKTDTFTWAETNLREAQANQERQFTVAWRYAILRMHEIIGKIAPYLPASDHHRFNRFLKPVFVDDYATVPHLSIERLLALHRAGKLDVLKLGTDYKLDTKIAESGAFLFHNSQETHFPAFIEAMGQRPLGVHEFPFPALHAQGIVRRARAANFSRFEYDGDGEDAHSDIGGIALDENYHPISDWFKASRLYCLSLPFLLGQFPFAQGITSSAEMGMTVAADIIQQLTDTSPIRLASAPSALEHTL